MDDIRGLLRPCISTRRVVPSNRHRKSTGIYDSQASGPRGLVDRNRPFFPWPQSPQGGVGFCESLGQRYDTCWRPFKLAKLLAKSADAGINSFTLRFRTERFITLRNRLTALEASMTLHPRFPVPRQ